MAIKKSQKKTSDKKIPKKQAPLIDKQAAQIDHLPPQNIEAEQSVLGSLMLSKDAIIRIADIIQPTDFYRGFHQTIYETMTELFEQNEPIDLLSLSNKLEEKKKLEEVGGISYLTELINTVPSAANVVHYAQIVRRKKIRRDLIEAAHNITQLGYQETENVESLLDESEQRIFSVSQRALKQNFAPIKPALKEALERLDGLDKDKGDTLRGIPTGFYELDNVLAGLQKSDFVILASRPSMGKTTLALDIARHVAIEKKLPIGIFSLEMSSSQLVDRILCSQAQINLWKLRTGRLSSEGESNDFSKIQEAIGALSESPIFIDDSSTATVMEVRTKARRLQGPGSARGG